MAKQPIKFKWEKSDWPDKLLWLVQQRRFWGAICGALSVIVGLAGWQEVSAVLAASAGALGGWSLLKPKKQ